MIDSAAAKPPENRIHLFDPVGLINDNYASQGIRAKRATRPYEGGSPLRFAVEPSADGDESGASSPRMWSSSPVHPQQPMSPDSRTQAIVRGRREMMDMIKDMPESFYELSLRDLVETKSFPPPDRVDDEKKSVTVEKPKTNESKIVKKLSKSESKKRIVKCRSIDNGGFLLKTSVFPMSFGLSKKKKKSMSASSSLKVAPKPPLQAAPASSSKAAKGGDKDWWNKKKSGESESGSAGRSSSNSSRSSSTNSRRGQSSRFLPTCCSFNASK